MRADRSFAMPLGGAPTHSTFSFAGALAFLMVFLTVICFLQGVSQFPAFIRTGVRRQARRRREGEQGGCHWAARGVPSSRGRRT